MRFKFLTGDINWEEYGGKFISKKLNNREFDYWIILEVINWENSVGKKEAPAEYNVSLSAVSPSEAKKEIEKAFESCGLEENKELKKSPIVQVECLHSYGVYSPLWNKNGNNLSKLMKEAKKQANICNGLFGFYMDGPKNAIGSTGWDFIKGDITAGLK